MAQSVVCAGSGICEMDFQISSIIKPNALNDCSLKVAKKWQALKTAANILSYVAAVTPTIS